MGGAHEEETPVHLRLDESDDADAPDFHASFRVRALLLALYCDGVDEILRRLGLMEFTIIGDKLAGAADGIWRSWPPIDYQGRNGPYDLVITCSDVYVQKNIRDKRIVLVQEGITDPETFAFSLVTRFRVLRLWLAGTAATGLSDAYGNSASPARGIGISSSAKARVPTRSSSRESPFR